MSKWKPKVGESFYHINLRGGDLIILKTTIGTESYTRWRKYFNQMFRLCNCFRTKAEANKVLKKIKQLLKGEGK